MFVKSIENKSNSFYIGFGKRLFDIVFSLALLIVLSPILIAIWLLVKLSGEGPGFFKQVRVGKNGCAFILYKFRTMRNDPETVGPLVTSRDDGRITVVGKYLRKYKLDELPQLYNVLIGDMSVVGPRPEAKKYVDLFENDYSYILQIYPGLTDYAALKFRNEEKILARYEDVEEAYIDVVLPEKILLYRKYINEMSFQTDLKIVIRTLFGVIRI